MASEQLKKFGLSQETLGGAALAAGALAVPTVIVTSPYIACYFFAPINTRIMLQQIAPEVPHL